MFTSERYALIGFGMLAGLFSLAARAEPSLIIQPQMCVLDSNGLCQTQLKMAFRDTERRAVCFAIRELLREECRPKAKEHVMEVQVETREDINITVHDADNRTILGEARMTMASFKPDATRKRRRFSWSFE